MRSHSLIQWQWGEGRGEGARKASKGGHRFTGAKIAVFDPKGETSALLNQMGIQSQSVDVAADLSPYDILIVGKSALTIEGAAPDIGRVREGLSVIVFEQRSEVLEKRFGFRVEEYGLRQVFLRVPDHPILAGISAEHLHDWRGKAAILPSRLEYEMRPRYGPTLPGNRISSGPIGARLFSFRVCWATWESSVRHRCLTVFTDRLRPRNRKSAG